jgi:hypothetical protein
MPRGHYLTEDVKDAIWVLRPGWDETMRNVRGGALTS